MKRVYTEISFKKSKKDWSNENIRMYVDEQSDINFCEKEIWVMQIKQVAINFKLNFQNNSRFWLKLKHAHVMFRDRHIGWWKDDFKLKLKKMNSPPFTQYEKQKNHCICDVLLIWINGLWKNQRKGNDNRSTLISKAFWMSKQSMLFWNFC
jgi:hypothetical protein